MVRVRVDSSVKRLVVTVAPANREVEPGSEARMNLRVTDHRGRGTRQRSQVWAVDEGVLSMGSYGRPDPTCPLSVAMGAVDRTLVDATVFHSIDGNPQVADRPVGAR
jgi:hypothetical protein